MKTETLNNLSPGKVKIISFDSSVEKRQRKKLAILGIYANQIIEIMQTGSPMIVKVFDSRLALGEPLISQILAKKIE